MVDGPTHPMLTSMLVPVRHLSLVASGLSDQNLDSISARLPVLELVDLSFNNFQPDSLLNFILAVNRVPKTEMGLRTLSFKGNSLRTSSERLLG